MSRCSTRPSVPPRLVARVNRRKLAATATADVARSRLVAAVEAFCDALQVFTLARHREDWGWTQAHLGRALEAQAEYCEGPERRKILTLASDAYDNAIRAADENKAGGLHAAKAIVQEALLKAA